MPDATTDQIDAETRAERGRLVALAAAFTPQQWATDSLCAGWRVREVVAHLTMPFRLGLPRFVAGMVRAGFSFDRFADADARAVVAQWSDDWLVQLWRDNVDRAWRPPGGGAVGALSHDLIHGLDITSPLGLPGPPPDRIALAVASAGHRNLDHFGLDLSDVRLEATDTDLAIGTGHPVALPAAEMLLVISGRRPVPPTPG